MGIGAEEGIGALDVTPKGILVAKLIGTALLLISSRSEHETTNKAIMATRITLFFMDTRLGACLLFIGGYYSDLEGLPGKIKCSTTTVSENAVLAAGLTSATFLIIVQTNNTGRKNMACDKR